MIHWSRTGLSWVLSATAQVLLLAPPAVSAAETQPQVRQSYDIAAGNLDKALRQFASRTGVMLSADANLLEGKSSSGLHGNYTAAQGFAALLARSGLQAVQDSAGSYTIKPASSSPLPPSPPPAATAEAVLPPVKVTATAEDDLNKIPPPHAGGQVARGAALGLLGNRDVMDTPFSQISYTEQTIQDQQARTLADVLDNDPAVRRFDSASGGLGDFSIRGFELQSADIGLNGLYGLAPANVVATDFLERVEVLEGPSALLSGMPPGGSVGGSINLITKRAGAEPLTRFTTSYISRGQFGEHVDVARRFGPDDVCGARFNGSYTGGNTAVRGSSNRTGVAALGLDCNIERLRVAADFGFQKNDTSGATRFVTFDVGVPVLRAPPADKLYTPSWSFFDNKDSFGMVSVEYDLAPNVTAYGAFGIHDYQQHAVVANFPTVIDTSGDYTSAARYNAADDKASSGQFGIRATTDTGPVHHALNLSGSVLDSVFYQSPFVIGTDFTSNLYAPVDIPSEAIDRPEPVKVGNEKLNGFAIADTLSVLDERVQVTVGVRHQEVSAESIDSGAVVGSYDESVWTPSYALVIKPLKNVSVYANYIEGLQQGSVVGSDFANAGQVFPPFVSRQAEVGVKVDWGKLTTTASVFQIKQPNLLTIPEDPLPVQALDGEQRNRGAELKLFGEIVPTARVLGGVMYLDGVQTKTQNGTDDGKKAPGVPHVQFNLGFEWDTPFVQGLTLTQRTLYTAEQFLDFGNTQTMPSWTRVDLGARYRTTAWNIPLTARLDVKNVADKNYWETNDFGFTHLGAPRTFFLSLTTDF
jgi:iron complex outermembrane receptor protein